MATTFQGYGGRLILESMNENFDGQYGAPTQPCYSNINAYNQIFVDTVRQTGGNNTSRWLLVPGWNTNIDYTTGSYGFVIPTDQYRSSAIPSTEKRLMISAHYYDPWDFTGTEDGTITQWGPNATNASKKSMWGQQDFMDAQLKKMYDTFVVKGYPVFIGEYGSIDKTNFDSTNNRYRADYARTLVATAEEVRCGHRLLGQRLQRPVRVRAVRPELRDGDPAGHHHRDHRRSDGGLTRLA